LIALFPKKFDTRSHEKTFINFCMSELNTTIKDVAENAMPAGTHMVV